MPRSFHKRKTDKTVASGRELTVRIDDLSRAGAGVARDESGRVVFVPHTAPGDRVRVRLVEESKRYAQAQLLEVIEPAPIRVKPPCPVFGRCGGCQWQHLPYEVQWKTKSSGVKHALSRVQIDFGGEIEELPAEQIWEYRNRVQLRGENGTLGFYESGTHNVIPIERCEIARPEINAAWAATLEDGRRFSHPYKVEVEVTESGEVRRFWNARHAAGGFRQVHDGQNDKLRAWVKSAISPGRGLLDLFGGSGNLSRGLAGQMKEVHCVDIGAPRQRPEGTPANLHFYPKPTLVWLQERVRGLQGPPLEPWSAILDPPRIGLDEEFGGIADALDQLNVRELVAVGCDPDSWARDVSRFARRGWNLKRVAALDLFPQTAHLESLAVLVR